MAEAQLMVDVNTGTNEKLGRICRDEPRTIQFDFDQDDCARFSIKRDPIDMPYCSQWPGRLRVIRVL
jgi:hypothetical protein